MSREVFSRPFLMAPMAGVTDEPFRKRLRRWGAQAIWTEMVSAAALSRGHKATLKMADPADRDDETVLQLFGAKPVELATAAKMVEEIGWKRIDFNMGCPVKKVLKSASGAALMKNLPLARECIEAVREKTSATLTVKIRTGWGEKSKNFLEAGKMAEKAGADGVILHGRTRVQGYGGKADWVAVRKLSDSLDIPVAGNGDITTPEKALERFSGYGARAVMIGRAALGAPWIFRDSEKLLDGREPDDPPSLSELSADLMEHFDDLVAYKGERGAVGEIKKFVAWAIKGIPGAAKERASVMKIKEEPAMREAISAISSLG